MDIASLIGLVGGAGLLSWGIFTAAGTMADFLKWFVNFPSVLITVGGTLASTMLNYPLPQVLSIVPILKNVFTTKVEKPNDTITTLVSLAEKARREGLLSLESDMDGQDNKFLKKGVQLVIDGTDPELVRDIMEIELEYLEERHKVGVGLFDNMGFYAPAFGMIGTLVGLIGMLKGLGGDPNALGPNMAIALVTTLYGAIMANFLLIPVAGKLKVRSLEETQMMQVMIQGIMAIQEGNNPRIVKQKLLSFLSPKIREELEADDAKGAAA